MRSSILRHDAAEILKQVDTRSLAGKSILITGATGMLGTYFLAVFSLLKSRGMKLNVTGLYHSEPATYTKQMVVESGFKLIGMNDPIYPGQYDVILHAAGYAQPAVFTKNPVETLRVNSKMTKQLLHVLATGGCFLFVSSSEVYSGLDGLVSESSIGKTTPNHPRACYIEGKRCGEAIVNEFREAGVNAKSARLGLTYGPGTRIDDQRAISGFIRQGLSKPTITMLYPGVEPRTVCYVRDAVEMLLNVLLHGKEAVYNVGGNKQTNMASIANCIAQLTGSNLVRPKDGNELMGAVDIVMDVSRAEKEFGKRMYVSLLDGLRLTVEWNRWLREPLRGN